MKNIDYYMKQPYAMKIMHDTMEKGFVISFPELPGCVTCGETLDAALANAEDAKREWIAASLEMGNTIPFPRKARLESCEKH